MSATVDQQRREDALHARLERAKSRMRQLQQLITFEAEGISISEQARRLGVVRRTVERWRGVLGMRNGFDRGFGGRPTAEVRCE